MAHVSDTSETNQYMRMGQFAPRPLIEIKNEATDGLSLRKETHTV